MGQLDSTAVQPPTVAADGLVDHDAQQEIQHRGVAMQMRRRHADGDDRPVKRHGRIVAVQVACETKF